MPKTAIIIGAGIVGLALARSLAMRSYKVTVLEKEEKATGASVRNFGMIWPVGQPAGLLHERALRSRSIWKKICGEAGIWFEETGSLHLAYDSLEHKVMDEFCSSEKHRDCRMLTIEETLALSPCANRSGLLGSLYNQEEMIVDPREALPKIASYLSERMDVKFCWNTPVTGFAHPSVWSGSTVYEADEIYICNGLDIKTLLPDQFTHLPLTLCKLQMMRTAAQPVRIGPPVCGGLSMIHYRSFAGAPSLGELRTHYEKELPGYIHHGIHVMVAQNGLGELTIGDSHEYGKTHDPFDRTEINKMILHYLDRMLHLPQRQLVQSWNGTYVKRTDGGTELVSALEEGVMLVNGLGGAGMTLSFGLAEDILSGS